MQAVYRFLRIYTERRMLCIFMLGIASGLPLALTASTLTAWLAEEGVSKTAIGLFAAVATPYALKFLWSPLMDATYFPLLCRIFGRRRGWLFACQGALAASIVMLGMAHPANTPFLTALWALLVAIGSASQDIVIDAYRVELLKPEEQGAGAAAVVLGYRIGMILSGAGALWLADQAGWHMAYVAMAALTGIGTLAALLGGEPPAPEEQENPNAGEGMAAWLERAVVAPFTDFMTRDAWLAILLFILLYKLGDAFMGVMTNPFLLEIGFSKTQIAAVVKLYGVVATIIGSMMGGALVYRIGMMKSLFICGLFHAVTNLMFVLLAQAGPDMTLLAVSISLENVSGGMGTAAFVAFIGVLCTRQFTATQYALLSSFSAFGRTWLSTPAGWVAAGIGWEAFFVLSAALAIPGLILLAWLSRRLAHMLR